ncbi:tag-278, partial [Pristionchus pacificus]
QNLEDTVAEYERQKYNVMGTFTEYRERVQEREKKLEADYSTKIISFSEEVLAAKKDFEQRMKHFQSLQERFEREKEQALEKLREEHQKEIQLLEQRFSESQLLNLEQKYLLEIQRLEEERKSLRQEKDRLGETFEMKLRRAQSLYETELAAAKMLYSRELEALRDHEEALKEELLARQEDFHDRIQELQHQAKRSRDELSSCKNEVAALEKKLFSKEAEVQQISQELEEARNETNDALRRLTTMESQLDEKTSKFQEQEEELRRKCDRLDAVEATKVKLEAVISALQNEVKSLKNRVNFLEKERQNLQSQSESQTQLQNSQVHALEAVLESVKGERESTKEHYENLLTKEREQADARELSMKKEFTIKLNELEEQYNSLKEDLQHTARLDKDELRESTEQELEALRVEKTALVAQVSALKAQFGDEKEEPEQMETRLAEILKQTDSLSECLQTQRERIASKDEEIARLRRRVEEENQVTEDQLLVLREEVRMEMMNAGNNGEMDELHARIAELEVQCEKDEQELEEDAEKIRSLETENTRLKEELGAHGAKDIEKDVTEALAEQETKLRDEFNKKVEEAIAAEKEKAEKEIKEQSENLTKQFEKEKAQLNSELAILRDTSGTSDQKLITLQAHCESLMDEMEGIKGELQKKTEQIENLTKSGDGQRTEEARRVLCLEDELLKEKKNHVEEIEGLRKEKESFADRISQLQSELEEKQRELTEQSEKISQPTATTSIDVQTDEMEKPAPVAIVDLAKEKELRIRIIELESALEQKEALISELHERIDTVIMDDMPKKKDRSASVGGEHSLGGIKCQKSKLHNFVSSMTDGSKKEKREAEAQAAAKKKEAEKAEKAAAHAIKEKSPSIQRSKSPSLLTRLRERSPGKAKMQQQSSSMENAGTLSSSSRNLLSPSDADLERRSPSRALFGRTKKESSTQPPPTTVNTSNDKKDAARPAWKI